jgi:hypothetical protein
VTTDGGTEGGSDTDCVDPTGPGTTHGGSVSADETWTAAASPHIVPYDLSVYAKLTLEPCAVVLIASQKTVTVGSAAASIVAQGTERRPVAIDQKDAGKPWAKIRALNGGTLSFTWTGILGGGDPLNTVPDLAAAVEVTADQLKPAVEAIHVDHVLVQDSASQGIKVSQSAAFSAASNGLVIKGSKAYPIFASANLVGTIPTGAYTGNGKDEILVEGSETATNVSTDTIFHDRGVPYHIGHSLSSGRLDVGTAKMGTLATLTIEPNVTLRFKKGGALYVETGSGDRAATGALIAVGAQGTPITFTSAEAAPAPGDWLGVYFYSNPDPTTKLDWVNVEFAGGKSASGGGCTYPNEPINNAAIRILSAKEPSSVFITNTTIKDSAAHGFDRGWLGDNPASFIPTNTFVNIARCKETLARPMSTSCPTQPPCP